MILPESFRHPQKKSSSTTGKQEESPKKKQCKEKLLEPQQLLWNLEPVGTADIYLPVEWTHLFFMPSNWYCPSRF